MERTGGVINRINEHLLDAPSIEGDACCVCGMKATNRHHVIPKGMGGSKLEKRIPTVPLCGMGNTSGCHGLAHSGMLFLDYRNGRWMYYEADEPTTLLAAMNDEDGWWYCDGQ